MTDHADGADGGSIPAAGRYPLAVHGRFVFFISVSVALAAALVAIALIIAIQREGQDPSTLTKNPAAKHEIDSLMRKRNAAFDTAPGTGQRQEDLANQRREDLANQILVVAKQAKLQDCELDDFGDPKCGGSSITERPFVVGAFWVGLIGGVFVLGGWLYTQLRDSWMLPRWSPQLWYTPLHFAVIAPLMWGPFLMAWIFQRRAESGIAIPPESWIAAEVPFPLLLVLALQLAVVTVSAVNARMPVSWFVVVAGLAIAIGLLYFQLGAFLSGDAQQVVFILAIYAGMIALTFRWLRRQRSEGPPGQLGRVHFGRRVWALSGGLLVAWVSVAVVIAAGGSLLDISWLHTSASVICCVACWVHLVTSKGRELSQP